MYYHPLLAFHTSEKFRIAQDRIAQEAYIVLLRSLLFAVSTKNKNDYQFSLKGSTRTITCLA